VSERAVMVFTTRSVPEAEIVRARLQDEGIPVIANGIDSPYRMGPVELWVPEELEVQARLVLDQAVEPLGEASEQDDAEPDEQMGGGMAGPDGAPDGRF
jgi:hypothetical protein